MTYLLVGFAFLFLIAAGVILWRRRITPPQDITSLMVATQGEFDSLLTSGQVRIHPKVDLEGYPVYPCEDITNGKRFIVMVASNKAQVDKFVRRLHDPNFQFDFTEIGYVHQGRIIWTQMLYYPALQGIN